MRAHYMSFWGCCNKWLHPGQLKHKFILLQFSSQKSNINASAGLRSLLGLQGRALPASASFGGSRRPWAVGHIPLISASVFTRPLLSVHLCFKSPTAFSSKDTCHWVWGLP